MYVCVVLHVTGGAVQNKVPEADVMANWLIEAGVDQTKVQVHKETVRMEDITCL